ncbi:MAG: Gfo/Idh/MocA family oxidoreductase [Anaerolineae bacterium]|nr:Gfo/Idh/MocA family oxidoreductase [Anaerolineae bacterium]
MKYQFGVIGAGSIARKRHLPELLDNPHVKIAAICDANLSRAKEMTSLYGGKAFSDYRDLIALKKLDAVIVCATNTTHAEMTIAALEAGKHVMCEKPMATTLADARAMIETAERCGKFLMIAHNQRLAPACVKAREILRSGKLGKVLTFQTVFGHPGCEYWAIDAGRTWFFNKQIAGLGVMGDLGIHKIDLVRWMLEDEFCEAAAMAGTLDKVDADGNQISVEDNALCLFKTRKGVIGTVTVSWTYQKEDNSTIFYCEKGVLRIYAHPEYQLIVDYSDTEGEYHKVGEIPTNVKQVKSGIVDLFVDSLMNNKPPEITGEDGYKALEAVMACFEAVASKRVVSIG